MAQGGRDPRPGDLIEIKRSQVYQHWALYVGDGYVIHVTDVGARNVFSSVGFSSTSTRTATVKKELLEDVAKNHTWNVNNKYDQYHAPRPVQEIIQDAYHFVGIAFQYNLMNNNCEHFVTLLRYDKEFSDQVKKAKVCGVALLAITTIIIAAWKKFSEKTKLSRIPVVQTRVRNEEREIPGDLAVEVHEQAEVPRYTSLRHPF